MYKSTKEVNTAFRQHAKEMNIPIKRGKPQNDQVQDTRMAYCDFVETLRQAGIISENLTNKAHYF